ncbi:hypothetical protein Pta02_53820 [Planobispora takensis]|uniref:Uncharacterized protein n=1 Tax=Planobispora takensis TaxID=1367882 RepID=A0A8J3SZ68_9ACTN|nr:hypothetical protein Pta02_53820 [Planobispora takensis]
MNTEERRHSSFDSFDIAIPFFYACPSGRLGRAVPEGKRRAVAQAPAGRGCGPGQRSMRVTSRE